jgi:hypothetical protein
LASFAIQRARAGDRVAVLDLDLDAPGIGTLLAADENGATATWGVADYLLERPLGEVDFRDYYHACRRAAVTGSGEILVIPAGDISPNREYLGKLARLDFEPRGQNESRHPLELLIEQTRNDLTPNWILIDARAGLSEPAGFLLSGLAHLHILLGTSSEQSWQGLRPIIERIGASRVLEEQPQLDCVLVQTMVPQDVDTANLAKQEFAGRALIEFREFYYAQDPEDVDDDRLWYIRDSEASDAPHVPIAIPYQSKFSHFKRIDDIADDLADGKPYQELSERIAQGFESDEES